MNTFISLWGLRRVATTSFKGLLWPSRSFKVLVYAIAPRQVALVNTVHRRHYGTKGKKLPALVQLVEGEKDVINLDKVEDGMAAAISWLKQSFTTSVVTRMTPNSLDKITVEVEGQTYPLKKVAQLGMPNPQTIHVNMSAYPELVGDVAKAIQAANLGFNPVVEKTSLRVPLPKVTGELREKLAKSAKSCAEAAKKRVRSSRENGINDLKKKKKTVSEDTYRRLEKYVQQLADTHTTIIEDLTKAKVTELTK